MATRAQHVGQRLRRYPGAHQTVSFILQAQGLARRRSQISRYFAHSRDFTGLQIGAGSHHLDGWLATDLVPTDFQTVFMNAVNPFPFQNGAFQYVVAEHIIEHLTFSDAVEMLKECHRVLAADGILRVSTPNILLLKSLMSPPLTPALERYVSWSNRSFDGSCDPRSVAHVVNRLHHEWGHRFLYDPETLIATVQQAGFTDVVRVDPNESRHPALRDIDSHALEIGDEFNQLESLIIEAGKCQLTPLA